MRVQATAVNGKISFSLLEVSETEIRFMQKLLAFSGWICKDEFEDTLGEEIYKKLERVIGE